MTPNTPITFSSRACVRLPSRTPRAATLDFVEPFGDVLRCVTDDGFLARGSRPGGPYEAQFQGRTVSLRRSRGLNPIRLRVSIEYTVAPSTDRAGWWEASLAGWVYEIRSNAGLPFLAFHWHPSSGRVTWPHLHAYGVNESVELHKLHPPTGTVTAGAVVRFLIEDLDVLSRRPDWQAILDRHAVV
jgi:hypothetical protein